MVTTRHLALGVAAGVVDVDFHEKAVELGLGKRIGAFELQGVLGGEHVEGLRQAAPGAGDGHGVFLHRLEECRLGARAGAVDLVGHQEAAEYGSGNEPEFAQTTFRFLQDLGAEEVGGHELRSALDALGIEAGHRADGLDQPGLAKAGHTDQQCVSTGEQCDEKLVDHSVLTKDDTADRRPHVGQPGPRAVDFAGKFPCLAGAGFVGSRRCLSPGNGVVV